MPVKKSFFQHIYNTCYNIHSKIPKVDVCATCFRLGIRITEAKDVGRDCSELEEELAEHQEKANMAYFHLKLAAEEKVWDPKEWTILCMDLQQTHTIPKTPIGTHYYHRKCNVYNFCISEVQTEKPLFFY